MEKFIPIQHWGDKGRGTKEDGQGLGGTWCEVGGAGALMGAA